MSNYQIQSVEQLRMNTPSAYSTRRTYNSHEIALIKAGREAEAKSHWADRYEASGLNNDK